MKTVGKFMILALALPVLVIAGTVVGACGAAIGWWQVACGTDDNSKLQKEKK